MANVTTDTLQTRTRICKSIMLPTVSSDFDKSSVWWDKCKTDRHPLVSLE